MKPKVVLTGATGYIGRHVLEHLLKRGVMVTAIVRKREGRLEARLGKETVQGLEVLEGDVTTTLCGLSESQISGLKDVQAFIHCAGMTQFETH